MTNPSHIADATLDERSNHCFGCSPINPQGLHLTFTLDTTVPGFPTATAQVQLTRMHEGPPGHIHGGIIATLMDEVMSKLNRPLKVIAMTRHMEIDYLRPSPLHQPLTLASHHLSRKGRKLFHQAELRNQTGELLAKAKGLFIIIDENHLIPPTEPARESLAPSP